MHCWLEVGDQAIMGADMDVAWAPNIDKPKNGFDVTLHTEDKAEAQRWYDALSEGGRRHAVRRDVLVAGLRLADRQVRRAVDGQRHSVGRLEAAAGLIRCEGGLRGKPAAAEASIPKKDTEMKRGSDAVNLSNRARPKKP